MSVLYSVHYTLKRARLAAKVILLVELRMLFLIGNMHSHYKVILCQKIADLMEMTRDTVKIINIHIFCFYFENNYMAGEDLNSLHKNAQRNVLY